MKVRIVLLLILICNMASAQSEVSQEVHWLSFEEAQERSELEPRPILVDIYTGWCGWCKRMEASTYRDPNVVQYINTHFYPVKYDAESKDTIHYLGQDYVNPNPTSSRSANQLTYKLLPQRRSYPSTVFMSPGFKTPMLYQGYISVKDISPYLLYFGDRFNNQVDLGYFVETYKKTASAGDAIELIKWKKFDEALKAGESDGKKTVVFLNNSNVITSQMMLQNTFGDSVIAELINRDFHAVKFDVYSSDTIEVNNQQLGKQEGVMFHSLVGAALKKNITFPTFLVFNKEGLMIAPVQSYLKPDQAINVLNFFSTEAYSRMTFQDYLKSLSSGQQ